MPLSFEDRQAVVDLMTRYAHAVDKDTSEEEFLELFTDDCLIGGPGGGPYEGADGVKEFAARVNQAKKKGISQSRHFFANMIIDGDDDEAHIDAYFLRTRAPLQIKAPPVVDGGTFDCVAKRVGGKWKLRQRIVSVDVWIA